MSSDTQKTMIYAAQDLPERVKSAWRDLREANPALYSPYFHIDYALRVAELRKDVHVAVLEKDNEIVAILPYQGESFARPVGAPMTDYHGVICRAETPYCVSDVLRNSPVGAYHYSALVGGASQDRGQHAQAAVMTFPEGVEKWRESRDSSFRKHQKSLRRRIRKVTDEIGVPRFVSLSDKQIEFDTLIKWKVAQYEASGYYNVLGADWTLTLLKSLWEQKETATLRLDMHSLYFGDHLAAIDTGLTDGETYHSWIVAYSPEYHQYSPGTQLLNQIINTSDKLGYKRIDLGTGIEGYKSHYVSEEVYTSAGFVALSGPAAKLSQLYGAAERMGQKRLSDAPGKLRRRYSQIAACEDTVGGRAKAMLSAVASRRR